LHGNAVMQRARNGSQLALRRRLISCPLRNLLIPMQPQALQPYRGVDIVQVRQADTGWIYGR
jgi:hypothetical protein